MGSMMNWHATLKWLCAFAFVAGIAAGIFNAHAPAALPDWRFLAVTMTIGLLVFPFVVLGIMRLHVAIGSAIGSDFTLEPPRLDRCFFSMSRPLDLLLFAAHLAFWYGCGVVLTFWYCWPHNFILGLSMIGGYFSIVSGIRLTLAYCAKPTAPDIT